MKVRKHCRFATRLYPILLLVFSVLVVYPPLAAQAQAPYVYYALNGNPWSLMRRDSDGSDPVTIYTPPNDWVRAVATDHVDKMYYYDDEGGGETIFKSDLDGSNSTTFLSAKVNALAAGKGYVYYALHGSPYSLMRRDSDGSNPMTIYTPSTDWVRAIAIDFANNKLYFYADAVGAETIYKSDLDGSNRTTFLSAKITALAVGDGYAYYGLHGSPYSLMRRDSDGSSPVTIYTPPGDGWVRAIAVDSTNDQLYFYDDDAETIYKSDLDGSSRTAFLSAAITALATHVEGPTSITLQRFSSEGKGLTTGIPMVGLVMLGLVGLAVIRRKTSRLYELYMLDGLV
jgi:hypothetical protein